MCNLCMCNFMLLFPRVLFQNNIPYVISEKLHPFVYICEICNHRKKIISDTSDLNKTLTMFTPRKSWLTLPCWTICWSTASSANTFQPSGGKDQIHFHILQKSFYFDIMIIIYICNILYVNKADAATTNILTFRSTWVFICISLTYLFNLITS